MLLIEISAAVCEAVLVAYTLELRVAGIVSAVNVLIVIERIVGIPAQAVDDVKGSLCEELVALNDVLGSILSHKGKRVVVL